MGEQTGIQWTHHTFNPWSGCAKVHRGCTHCYAEALPPSMRRGAAWGEVWQGGQRVVAAEGYWRLPLAWARAAALTGERQRVFCASTADVLEVPSDPPFAQLHTRTRTLVNEARAALNAARQRLWGVIRQTSACGTCTMPATCYGAYEGGAPEPSCDVHCGHGNEDGWCGRGGLDWLLLTKRPEHCGLVPDDVRPLVWLGTSVSDQKTADEWVPRLLKAEGFRLRFLSVEPLIGPVDLEPFLSRYDRHGEPSGPRCDANGSPTIGWVIIGGESGRKAEPCQVEWVRDVVRQCREAGVPCFVKQLGAAPWQSVGLPPPSVGFERMKLQDPKGGDMVEWPENLRVRQLPAVRHG